MGDRFGPNAERERLQLGHAVGSGGGHATGAQQSAAARMNILSMERRQEEQAAEKRAVLAKRSSKPKMTRKRKPRKKIAPALTDEEQELRLLDVMEFASRTRTCFVFGSNDFCEIQGPSAAAVRILKLNEKQLRHIKHAFDKIDVDGGGKISNTEFFDIMGLSDTRFTRELCNEVIFNVADADNDEMLSFEEFLLGACVMCTLTRDQLLFFCFRVFDEDHSGHLANNEFKYLAEAINEAGGALFPGNVGALLENFDANNDGGVDFFEFLEIDQQFPMAFFPVFRMQDTLQSRTLTPDIWINLVEAYNKEEFRRSQHRDPRLPFLPVRSYLDRVMAISKIESAVNEREQKRLEELSDMSASSGSSFRSTEYDGTESGGSPRRRSTRLTTGDEGSEAGSPRRRSTRRGSDGSDASHEGSQGGSPEGKRRGSGGSLESNGTPSSRPPSTPNSGALALPPVSEVSKGVAW